MRSLSENEKVVADGDHFIHRTRVERGASNVRFLSDRILPWDGSTLTLEEYRERLGELESL